MHLEQPIWLLLIAPLAVVVWVWPGATRVLTGLRVGALVLLVLGMCRPALTLPDRSGVVVVVADRSLSMPGDAGARQEEAIRLLAQGMGRGDRLAVVSFGRGVGVERGPEEGGGFEGFELEVDRDGSDLAGGIERGAALIPPGSPGRLLVLSDGRWTGEEPTAAAGRVAMRGIGIDYREVSRSSAGDVAIERVDMPATVGPGEGFTITAWVLSPTPGRVSYELKRTDAGGTVTVAKGERAVGAGRERLTFRDRAGGAGTASYELRVLPVAEEGEDATSRGASINDPVPGNNVARVLLGIDGPRPILAVTPKGESGLVNLLRGGGLEIVRKDAGEVDWTLAGLSGYSGVILENVPAEGLGERGMDTLASWVSGSGAGLMMMGGTQSFGPGGYYQSPLEAVLPVTMELRQEHRKLALAIVVALDRSGSMTAPVSGGKTKMDLANLGTAEVVDLLSSMDEIGVIAVDTMPHLIQPLGPVTDKGNIRSKVLRIESMGGGIYVEAALKEAASMLQGAKASTRHIVLFADAADAEQPGRYVELIRNARAAGMTVSVIGLGTKSDPDAALLEDIAKRGGGRLLLTTDAKQLPRLFAQDTFVVARSSFIDEVTPVEVTAGMGLLTGGEITKAVEEVPPVGGYNLVYTKEGADVGLRALDEYNGPVVAAWRAGTGRVAVYTGEADGEHAGPIAGWTGVGEMFSSLARWVSVTGQALPPNMLLVQRVDDRGTVSVELHLDPERPDLGLESIPKVTTLRGDAGGGVAGIEGVKQTITTMAWRSPDVLGVDISLTGDETALSTVDMGVYGTRTLPPVRLAYSPEYEPVLDAGAGEATLAGLAAATGGERRVDLAGMWDALPRVPQSVAVAHWLLLLAAALVLLEVLERRTGLLTSGRWREVAVAKLSERREARAAGRADKRATREAKRRRRAAGEAGGVATLPEDRPGAGGPAVEVKEEGPGLGDALRRAKSQAGRRAGGR